MEKKDNFLDYLGVIILVLASDAICFLYTLKPLFAFLTFFIYSVYRYAKIKPLPVYKESIRYFVILGLSILLNVYVVNTNITGNNGLAIFICMVGSYMFFTSFTFQRFREVYLNVIFIITIIGIPVYLLVEWGLLPTTRITTFEGASRLQFFIYSVGWTELHHRFAGIWHEAGACMIFLNIALLLYSNSIRDSDVDNPTKWKLIIISIGVLATQSTTGYLAFMGIIIYCFYPKILNASAITKLLYSVLIIAACYYIINSDVIVDKFAQDSTEGAQTSYAIRRMDNLSMLTMAIEQPLFGYGYQTVEFENRAFYLGNITSSNGILYMAACAGIWWVIFYVIFLYVNIRKQGMPMPLLVVAIFILLQCNERFVELPISYVFLTAFCLESQNKKIYYL